MAWVITIILSLMVICIGVAAAGERPRDASKLTIGQALVEYGWIALVVCGIVMSAKGF